MTGSMVGISNENYFYKKIKIILQSYLLHDIFITVLKTTVQQ